MMEQTNEIQSLNRKLTILILVLATFWIYYFSNPKPQHYYDYTFRVAENMLRGAIAFGEKPPSWLNEFVPFDGGWYSVFPLGSVVSMMPAAFFKAVGVIGDMPAALIAALSAAVIGWFLLLIAGQYDLENKKRILMVGGILFGTWMWTNLTMAGAWQLALGFAMIGELGAIYFTVFRRRPLLAGAFFALAFGNRTEILLTAPVLMYLLLREREAEKGSEGDGEKGRKGDGEKKTTDYGLLTKDKFTDLARFCAVPFVLGVSTLVYNYVRFHSFTDFGYARIPGVLDEPWYRYGIFSLWYIPLNFEEMLVTPWRRLADYPYFVPGGFGGAIWWSSPFLFFLLFFGARDRALKYAAWTAIAVLTLLLWIHGNPGGWQFAYRYAMVLLPWMFVILLENSPQRVRWYEWFAYLTAFVINAWATYLFHWTDYVKP